jgi:hypothetical protein
MSVSFFACRRDGDRLSSLHEDIDDDVNLSNSNGRLVLRSLGIEPDPELCGQLPIVTFLNICRSWLRSNFGTPSLEIETVVDGNFIDCGIGEGYINRRVHELAVMAHKGREAGATDIVWS